MPSSPLGSTNSRTTSGVACYHHLWAAHTVERRRAWHTIIAFGWQTRSNDFGHGMQTSPLGSTDGRTASGVACHHRPWTENMVERLPAWHYIIPFGQHRRSDGVRRCMSSSPFSNTHSQTTSGVACHHRLGTAHTVGRRWALHAIIAFGQHT